jgi:hypothetical protein
MFGTKQALNFLGGFVLVVVVAFFFCRTVSRHIDKHTGPCTVTFRDASERCYYFSRPNGEMFITCFDNPPAFSRGMVMKDMVYHDDNEDFKHFVKAQF